MRKRAIEVKLRRFEDVMAMSKAAVAPSMMPRRRKRSLRQRSALAAFGSNTRHSASAKAGITGQMALEFEARQTASSSKEPNFGVRPRSVRISASCAVMMVNDEAEPRLSAQTARPFSASALHLGKRISDCQEVCDQVVAAISSKSKITDSVCGIESATHQLAALSGHALVHGMTHISETTYRFGLIALQSALFDQIVAKLAEAKSVLVVAETRSGDAWQTIHTRSTMRRCCHARG